MSAEEHIEARRPRGVMSHLLLPFASLKIGTRLRLCFAVLLGLVAASDLIALWQVSRLSGEVNILYLVDQKEATVERIHTDIVDYIENLQGLAEAEDPRRFAEDARGFSETLRQRTDTARQAILKPGAGTSQDPVLLTMLASIQSTLPSQTATLIGLATAGDWRAVHLRLDRQETALGKLTASLARKVEAEIGRQRERVLADTLRTQRQIFLVFPLTVLLTLVTAGFLSVVVTRTITAPLARLDHAAQALARGDFSGQVPVVGHDELANLGRVFNDSSVSLRSYYSALQQSEAKFRSYIENSPNGIFVVDREGRFADFNQAVAQLLAYDPQGLRQITIHRIVSKARQPALNDFLTLPDNGRVTGEWELQASDGRAIPVTLQGVGLGGGLAMAYLFDLTERRQAEHEQERLRGQFLQAQKMESVGRLAGGIAHDFNNLLTVINGYTALSLSRTQADNPLREALEQVLQAGERAAALVQQLSAFSRKQVLKPQVVDVNQVVREISGMAPRLMGEDVEVVTRLMPGLPRVLADRSQIGQVLLNLIVNARDAMPTGGTVSIETEEVWLDQPSVSSERGPRAGRYVCLAVRDTGVGIDPATREKLFEPFFTTKDAGKGTGLGLSTAHGIVLQSDGHITVDSEPGKGATFRVYLPATSLVQTTEIAPLSVPATGTERILVVEDQVALRKFVVDVLKRCGYQVASAGSAEDALLSLAERPADLMLTDLIMPKGGGYELAADAGRQYPGLRFLFMSGYSDHPAAGTPIEGVLLSKPFSPDELAAKVRESLDRAVPRLSL